MIVKRILHFSSFPARLASRSLARVAGGLLLASCFLLLTSCGQGSQFFDDVVTSAPPIVIRIDPSSGPVGSQATIFGLGFSNLTLTNVVSIGDAVASAEEYALLENPTNGEIESITFTIPAGLAEGDYPVVVIVYETASNTDIHFQVTP